MSPRSPRGRVARPSADAAATSSGRQSVPMRLAVSGGSLGLELYQSVSLGPLEVQDLAWSLPDLRFPIDLSGGVDVFRHRRGELQHLRVRGGFAELARHLRPRLREALGQATAPPEIWPLDEGIGVGLVGVEGALAFDLLLAPAGADLRFVVANARGAGEVRVPLSQALRVAETMFGSHARRRGRVLTLGDLSNRIARRIAPALGARAPGGAGAVVESVSVDADGVQVVFRGDREPPAIGERPIRALELAHLSADADDELGRGNVEAARDGYLSALEQAPRHPELTALVAQIDAAHADRAEAALGMLVDCMPATQFGRVGAHLLARVGDRSGARTAVLGAASAERYAPLAASLWVELAALSSTASDRRDALDRAVAAAPSLASARWARLEARVSWGDERGALGDAESLEAAAKGARHRHDALVRAARLLVDRGFVRSAGQLFERALRYLPDDPDSTYGLAVALQQTGRADRATVLLERAIDLGQRRGTPAADALVALATLLAEQLDDLPQAIARVSQVPASSERIVEALALEGRWRSRLGDLRGASIAYGRLRDACELFGSQRSMPRATHWLTEAAELERRGLGDLAAAERHLAAALRLSPKSEQVRRLYRRAAGDLARKERT